MRALVSGSSDLAGDEEQRAGADRLRGCGPIAAGAADVETASRIDGLRRLDDLARTEAARAHAQPLMPPCDARVGGGSAEPPGSHVMRVADVPSDDGTFSADFATFCHGLRSGVGRRDLHEPALPRRRGERSAQTSNYTPTAQLTQGAHTFVLAREASPTVS